MGAFVMNRCQVFSCRRAGHQLLVLQRQTAMPFMTVNRFRDQQTEGQSGSRNERSGRLDLDIPEEVHCG